MSSFSRLTLALKESKLKKKRPCGVNIFWLGLTKAASQPQFYTERQNNISLAKLVLDTIFSYRSVLYAQTNEKHVLQHFIVSNNPNSLSLPSLIS